MKSNNLFYRFSVLFITVTCLNVAITFSRSVTVDEEKERSKGDFSDEDSTTVGDPDYGPSLSAVHNASCKCEGGFCVKEKGKEVCKCPAGWGLYPGSWISDEYCKECDCGKKYNCTFPGKKKKCTCEDGYEDVSGKCKGTCRENPCQNGGKCSVKGQDIDCNCTAGFTGDRCEKRASDPCSSNPCQNGGKCSAVGAKVNCKCKDGFTGDFCEKECKCENGNCKEVSGKMTCVCNPEYGMYKGVCKACDCRTGANCTFDPGFLSDGKTCICPNGFHEEGGKCIECKCENGKCQTIMGKVTCVCNPEFGLYEKGICKACDCGVGANCTFDVDIFSDNKECICPKGWQEHEGKCVDVCNPDPCKNGGICSVEKGIRKCTCRSNYGGELCQLRLCLLNPCRNKGECHAFKGKEMCRCSESFVGNRCEINLCSPNPCQNNGRCYGQEGKAKCLCEEPSMGDRCEKKMPISTTPMLNSTRTTPPYTRHTTTEPTKMTSVKFSSSVVDTTTPDPCSINPCRNGGICKADGYETRCYCIAPFTGEFCEDDPCTSSPCLNGGLCIINGTDFRCECRKPFYGRVCQKDPCSENPCQNQGTCFVVGKSIQCICKEPFAGNRCEVDPCMSWNPCKNGGVCKVVNNAVKCFCEKSYTGEFCDSRTGIDGTTIIFATISSLLVVILLFVSCILCQSVRLLKSS